jgi:hypothetical protein
MARATAASDKLAIAETLGRNQSRGHIGKNKGAVMKATTSPIYRWRVGEVEITRVPEFEAALFEPAVIHPEASPEIIERHRAWLEPNLRDPVSGLLIFAFHAQS